MSIKVNTPTVKAKLKGMVVGGGDVLLVPDLEYIVDVHINENSELVMTTNYDREINAGEVPPGPAGPAGSVGPQGPEGKSTEVLVVNFHQEDDVWLSSKTVDEIKAAIVDGDVVVCEYYQDEDVFVRGQLLAHNENMMLFGVSIGPIGYYFALYADGTVEFTPMLLDTDNMELFPVTVTVSNGVYAADRSFQEINEQINMGNVVVCDFVEADSKTRCPLINYTAYSATFVLHSVLDSDAYFHITADGVSHMAAESEDAEETPTRVQTTKSGNEVTVMAYYDSRTSVTVITLNDAGDPVSVARGDEVCALTWEGFDE